MYRPVHLLDTIPLLLCLVGKQSYYLTLHGKVRTHASPEGGSGSRPGFRTPDHPPRTPFAWQSLDFQGPCGQKSIHTYCPQLHLQNCELLPSHVLHQTSFAVTPISAALESLSVLCFSRLSAAQYVHFYEPEAPRSAKKQSLSYKHAPDVSHCSAWETRATAETRPRAVKT